MSRTSQKQINSMMGELGKAKGHKTCFIKKGREAYGELNSEFGRLGLTRSPYANGQWQLYKVLNYPEYSADAPTILYVLTSVEDLLKDDGVQSEADRFFRIASKFKMEVAA